MYIGRKKGGQVNNDLGNNEVVNLFDNIRNHSRGYINVEGWKENDD